MAKLTFGWGMFRQLFDWSDPDDVQIKADYLKNASDAVVTVTAAATAFAGGGQGSATLITTDFTNVTTVATAGDSVKLPLAVTGKTYTIKNNGANNLAVFPNTSDTINGGSANASITLFPGTEMTFTAISAVNWQSNVVVGTTSFTSTTGITAFAGGGQASAVALTTYFNNITTCATAGDSVKLMAAAAGSVQVVKNSGATALDIFPAASDSIDALAINLAVRIQPGSTATFYAKDAIVWESSIDETITVVAPTTNTGAVVIKATPSAGNFTTTITNASQAAARVYTIPDAGANASFVQTEGAQTINGIKTFGNPLVYSSATAITAFAGGGQGSATALTKEYNEITVCATAGDSVLLPAAVAGQFITVKNNGATAADVFPASGDSIDAAAVDTAIRLAVGATMTFRAVDGTVWESSLPGAGTVGNPSLPIGTPNKGFYQVSANQIGAVSNGALVGTIDTLGFTADSLRNRVNLGTTPVGTVSIVEYGDGKDITTVLTLTNFIVGALAGAGANLGIGNIVYAYPAGQHLELVYSLSSIVLTCAGTAVATDTGLGSVIASGAVAVLSGTATFEDRLTGQTINTAVGGGAAVSALTAATAGIGTGIALNVAGSVKNVYLNSAGAWNADNTGNLTASGTIILKWSKMS